MKQHTRTVMHPAAMRRLVHIAWERAQRILWRGEKFSFEEIKVYKKQIENYFRSVPAEKLAGEHHLYSQAFKEFLRHCRQEDERTYAPYNPYPLQWLAQHPPAVWIENKVNELKQLSSKVTPEKKQPSTHFNNTIHIHIHQAR